MSLERLGDVLRAVAPHLTADQIHTWTEALTPAMQAAWIDTDKRIAMFIGQAAEESGGFTELVEDLWYNTPAMCRTWPDRFPTVASAVPYARNPEKLGNHVYAGRGGNGDEASGDGFLFRGRGIFQVTFRNAYCMFASSVGRDLAEVIPWMETPAGAAQSATAWWTARGHMNELADAWDIRTVTMRINGGVTALTARATACTAALAVYRGPPAPIQSVRPPHEMTADELDNLYNPGA
jgi:putative chitinase